MKTEFRGLTPAQLQRATMHLLAKAKPKKTAGRKPLPDALRASVSLDIRVTASQKEAYERTAPDGNVSKWARALLDRAANFNPASA